MPRGWSIDDPLSDDGAPVSALTINDNASRSTCCPAPRWATRRCRHSNPPVEYYSLDNRIRTVAAGGERRIHLVRVPGSMELGLWGTIPLGDGGQDLLLGIEDPALYAAMALRELLEHRGIAVAGRAVARHLYPHDAGERRQPLRRPARNWRATSSAPLLEDLRITDKVSQNLHAEMALRAVARARRNIGSFEAGREEMKAFLGEVGVDAGDYSCSTARGFRASTW